MIFHVIRIIQFFKVHQKRIFLIGLGPIVLNFPFILEELTDKSNEDNPCRDRIFSKAQHSISSIIFALTRTKKSNQPEKRLKFSKRSFSSLCHNLIPVSISIYFILFFFSTKKNFFPLACQSFQIEVSLWKNLKRKINKESINYV
jgi:hypothetical protein